jgi:hypothetical protein
MEISRQCRGVLSGSLKARRRLISYLFHGDLGLSFIDFGSTSGFRVESFSVIIEKAMGRGTEQLERFFMRE